MHVGVRMIGGAGTGVGRNGEGVGCAGGGGGCGGVVPLAQPWMGACAAVLFPHAVWKISQSLSGDLTA